MSDAQGIPESGVAVWRIAFPDHPDEVDDCGNISESATYAHEHVAKEAEFDGYTTEPGRWYPAAVAAAMEDVVRLARDPRRGRIRMQAALERLDAAQRGDA